MSTSVEDLAAQANALSPEDRSRLAELLLASLPDDAAAEVEASWDAEIKRRVAEVEAGTARTHPADEVHEAARKMYQR